MTNHNQPPHQGNQPDEDNQPDLENGEIDLTGALHQREQLRDVIGDALVEARNARGEVPDWGARAIARALANTSRADPYEVSALHQFAVTGTGDPEQIVTEMMRIFNQPDCRAEVREWINYLGTYLIHFPPSPQPTATGESEDPELPLRPDSATTLSQVSAYLDETFEQADRAGIPISTENARAIATLLVGLLPNDSAMRDFADTGTLDTSRVEAEIDGLYARVLQTPQIRSDWLPRLSAHLHAADSAHTPSALSVEATEGIASYGTAFRAFLELPDIDPSSGSVLEAFHDNYVGSFADITDLLERLTELPTWRAALRATASELGIEHLVSIDLGLLEHDAREAWDVVTYQNMLYAFEK